MSIWNSAFSVPTSPFFRQIALLSSLKTACMDEKFLCSIMPTYYVPVLKYFTRKINLTDGLLFND